ncbi:MAG: PP2C family protein-serine/threonine phosphatase, partial [Terrabacter sp.]
MAIAFHFAARSDVGMVRTNNEDSGYAGPHLLAMADGMGGHAGGDVASSTVLGALVPLDGESFSGADATQALLRRITAANAELGQMAQDDQTSRAWARRSSRSCGRATSSSSPTSATRAPSSSATAR